MKIKIFILIFALSVLAFQTSPYARRIRPVVSTPASCAENEIAYNMTDHSLLICTNSGYTALTTGGSGSFAPSNATYIVQTANGSLSNEQALSVLATGIVKNTTTTGVLSIAAAGDVNSILPTQTGHSGEFLTTNGTVSSWAAISSFVCANCVEDVIQAGDGAGNLKASPITMSGSSIFVPTLNITATDPDNPMSMSKAIFEGSDAWYFNNINDGQEVFITQHNLTIAPKDSLRIKTGVDDTGAASAKFDLITNYLNQDLDGTMTFEVGSRASDGPGGNVHFSTGAAVGSSDQDGGNFRILLGAGAGSGNAGQFKIVNIPTSDPSISDSFWSKNNIIVRSGVAFSGTGGLILGTVTSPSINDVLTWDGSNWINQAAGGGGGALGTGNINMTVANDAGTGTTTGLLAKLTGAPSTVRNTQTSDTENAIGICTSGCGTTGNATIAIAGQVDCQFDGSTTAGNYVVISATDAGKCHDNGSAFPTDKAAYGRVLTTNVGAGTYSMTLMTPDIAFQNAGNGKSKPGGSNTQVQYNSSGVFGGSSLFTFTNTGVGATSVVLTPGGSSTLAGLDIGGGIGFGRVTFGLGYIASGSYNILFHNGISLRSNGYFSFTASGDPADAIDIALRRETTNRLGIVNSTTPTGWSDLTLRNLYTENNNLLYSSGTPSISGNGTLDSGSRNSAGKVSINNTGASSVTLTFSIAFSNAPACNVTNETTANLARATSTTTTVVLAGTTVTGDKFAYNCIGY